ncbi:MAG TPA: ABC transporter substrate-binding protein [Ilumatobacteraceae bacterium]|nr:ABC transporter substrate-binding protein [Ilumatobacteraceae bacterium]
MRKTRIKGIAAVLVAVSLFAACSDDDKKSESGSGDTTAAGDCEDVTPVKLQLQWVTQAQFAGYYAAVDKGFYAAQCLDVTILEGAVDIVPQTVLANGEADFAIAWVPKALASREAGANIVDIAQVFQRSGTLQVSFADSGITSPADYAGKKIGNWGYGNEFEVFAAMTKAGIDPADVTNVAQQFDMLGLLAGDIDAAEAMTYNEYAQVLEAKNPATGELYQPSDFNVISYEDEGVGMLQDAIWADGSRLSDAAYKDTAIKFVAASLQGWAYCRDNVDECANLVTAKGSQLGLTHQTWQMNEINKLIWPAADGVGYIQADAWDRTAQLAQETKNLEGTTVLTKAPDAEAYTNDIVTEAYKILEALGVDINGSGYAPIEVTLTEGGV